MSSKYHLQQVRVDRFFFSLSFSHFRFKLIIPCRITPFHIILSLQLVRQGHSPLSMLCAVITCRPQAVDLTLTDLWNLEIERDESNLVEERNLVDEDDDDDGAHIKHLLLQV